MTDKIRVMLCDDSFVIRAALEKILSEDPDIEIVAKAKNGQIGIETAEKIKPDICILDVEMPEMDGITALPKILAVSPKTKVIMFSTLTLKGADITMKALSLGAVECLGKPSAQQTVDEGEVFKNHLKRLVRNLYAHKLSSTQTQASPTKSILSSSFELRPQTGPKPRPTLLAIGSSTGGPNALFEVLSHLKDLPIPIILTQHMPPTFTKALATHIEAKTNIPAYEGETGMKLEPGKLILAPGGFHMLLEKDGLNTLIKLDDGPPINYCKPSVDPMIESAVKLYGNGVLGTILTGMGSDGLGGGKDIIENGGRIIAQDEATSTVWGMPRAVAVAGICSAVLPLKEIGPWLRREIIT